MSGAMPHVEGVSHRHVVVNGFRMHVAEAGAPDAEPVVLLHGWPQHWYEWRAVIGPLAERHRVICPDLRGLGWSDAPYRGYEKEQLAGDILALLDALGLDRVKLVGHDWGGWVGFLVCLMAPERVERFLALNVPHPFQRPDLVSVAYFPRTWYQLPIEAPVLNRWFLGRTGYVKWLLRLGLADPGAMSAEEYEAFAARLRDRERIDASAQIYRTFTLREVLPGLRGRYRRLRLRVPTLVLFGVKDIFVPVSLLRGYEDYADDLRVERVEDAGHFIVDEKPELVARRTLEFFAAAPAAAIA